MRRSPAAAPATPPSNKTQSTGSCSPARGRGPSQVQDSFASPHGRLQAAPGPRPSRRHHHQVLAKASRVSFVCGTSMTFAVLCLVSQRPSLPGTHCPGSRAVFDQANVRRQYPHQSPRVSGSPPRYCPNQQPDHIRFEISTASLCGQIKAPARRCHDITSAAPLLLRSSKHCGIRGLAHLRGQGYLHICGVQSSPFQFARPSQRPGAVQSAVYSLTVSSTTSSGG
jgi:hypothetical protein